ncbi:sensor histidine kinase [Azospirillum halopraeferens]|uniref:sensor histidine kinase n=1 Tax=Azospirillum halopraeferens TaxID=34010 RepID=UPI0003FB811B|nr:ATP-binding protein [Azospirillum halopraeferens]
MALPGIAALRRPPRAASFILGAVLMLTALWTVGEWRARSAAADLEHAAEGALALHLAALLSGLDKHRSVPFVLARDPEVAALLRDPADPDRRRYIDHKLDLLNAEIRADVIYVIDGDGNTLAASNWSSGQSFVGHNYGFRPYFRNAMRDGLGEHFAMGTVSHQPGFYIARRVDAPDAPGVVVVKVRFEDVEAAWARSDSPVFVTDGQGVVILTSRPDWRFRPITPLPEETRRVLRESRRYGAAPLAPLPFATGGPEDAARVVLLGDGVAAEGDPGSHLLVAAPIPGLDWTMHILVSRVPVHQQVALTVIATGFAGLLLLFGLSRLQDWRTSLRERIETQQRARAELEEKVAARTRELTEANERLLREAEERRRAEVVARQARADLVHAGRLAVLGQISASIAHEINQPLGAIRSYADNAVTLLRRERADAACDNMHRIAGLTERIGTITSHLKGFARRTSGPVGVLNLEPSVRNALALMEHRIRRAGIRVEVDVPAVQVRAEPVQLEQVLVNLLQNAADAQDGRPAPRIAIRAERRGATCVIAVEDDGPGIPEAMMPQLFAAFHTTKAGSGGLGLGLSIARNIVETFGGTIAGGNRPDGGAVFTVVLECAP